MERVYAINAQNMKNLKRERAKAEAEKRLNEALPNRREREEIVALREEIQSLNEKWKSKEARMVMNQERLRRRTADVELKNRELAESIKIMEQERAYFVEKQQNWDREANHQVLNR